MAMKTWDEAEENKKKKKVNDSSPVLPMIVPLSLFSFFLFNNPMNIRERNYVYKIEVCSQCTLKKGTRESNYQEWLTRWPREIVIF